MSIFSSKVTLQVPTESLWDYVLGAEEQTRSQAPIIFDVDDPDVLHLSAADVAAHARRFAETLTAAGVRPEDRVLFVYPASIYSAPFLLANYLVGATFIPLSAEITPSELQVIFEHSKPTAIVLQPGAVDLGRGLQASSEPQPPSLLCLDSSSPLPSLYSPTPGKDLLERDPDGDQTTRSASSPCVILYTSGTSGKPKGFVYSEKTLLAGIPSPVWAKSWPTKLTLPKSSGKWRHRSETSIHDRRPDGTFTQAALRTSLPPLQRDHDATDLLALPSAGLPDARLQRKGSASECEGMRYQRRQNPRVDRAGHVTLEGSNQLGSAA